MATKRSRVPRPTIQTTQPAAPPPAPPPKTTEPPPQPQPDTQNRRTGGKYVPATTTIQLVDGAERIDPDECLWSECHNKRQVKSNGFVHAHCSKACKDKWFQAGSPFVQTPCQCCEKLQLHDVLQCDKLTEQIRAEMTEKFGYEHNYQYSILQEHP